MMRSPSEENLQAQVPALCPLNEEEEEESKGMAGRRATPPLAWEMLAGISAAQLHLQELPLPAAYTSHRWLPGSHGGLPGLWEERRLQ